MNYAKKITILILFWTLMATFFSGMTNAADIVVGLSMTDQANVEAVGEMDTNFAYHLEHGNLLLNGQIIGSYRIIGFGYSPFSSDKIIKTGELYLEVNGMGYLFIKGMTNSTSPDSFEGIISGGTGGLLGYKGTVSGHIPQSVGVPVSFTLHFQ